MDVCAGTFRKGLRKLTSQFSNISSTSAYFFIAIERIYMLNPLKQMLSDVKTNCVETLMNIYSHSLTSFFP